MTWAGVSEWRSSVLKAGLPPGVEHTALVLAHHSHPENGMVNVSERRLAVQTCQSRTTVWNHLQMLQDRKLIRRSATAGPRRTSVYVLVFPEARQPV